MMQGMLMRAPRRHCMAAPSLLTPTMSPMARRMFSTPTMELQYMVHTARVKVNLPQAGQCWFFINPQDTVSQIVDSIKSEDTKISTAEVLTGTDKKQEVVRGSETLYSALQDNSRCFYLKLNDMLYKFDQGEAGQQTLDLTEKNPVYDMCKTEGLSNIQSSTVATIMRQVKQNLVGDESAAPQEEKKKRGRPKKSAATPGLSSDPKEVSYSVDDICNKFQEQSNFFECAIVREEVFQLRALKLLTKNEFEALDARKIEIE